MHFRFQAFDGNRRLVRGWVRAPHADRAREALQEIFECIVQFRRGIKLSGPILRGDEIAITWQDSEQFIPEQPPRNVVVRTDSGPHERRIIGHVELLGGREYLQLWTCIALFVGTLLLLWSLFPPARDADLRDWYPVEQSEQARRYDNPVYKASLLGLANSLVTFIGLLVLLALKRPLPRIALSLFGLYFFQWIAYASLIRISGDAYGAVQFLADYPIYTIFAWTVPIVVTIAAERVLRRMLDMTVPVHEDPETGRIEVGVRGSAPR